MGVIELENTFKHLMDQSEKTNRALIEIARQHAIPFKSALGLGAGMFADDESKELRKQSPELQRLYEQGQGEFSKLPPDVQVAIRRRNEINGMLTDTQIQLANALFSDGVSLEEIARRIFLSVEDVRRLTPGRFAPE